MKINFKISSMLNILFSTKIVAFSIGMLLLPSMQASAKNENKMPAPPSGPYRSMLHASPVENVQVPKDARQWTQPMPSQPSPSTQLVAPKKTYTERPNIPQANTPQPNMQPQWAKPRWNSGQYYPAPNFALGPQQRYLPQQMAPQWNQPKWNQQQWRPTPYPPQYLQQPQQYRQPQSYPQPRPPAYPPVNNFNPRNYWGGPIPPQFQPWR